MEAYFSQSIFEIVILLVHYLIVPKFIPEDKEIIKNTHNFIYEFLGKLPDDINDTNKKLY